jgi:hypothetical protein
MLESPTPGVEYVTGTCKWCGAKKQFPAFGEFEKEYNAPIKNWRSG